MVRILSDLYVLCFNERRDQLRWLTLGYPKLQNGQGRKTCRPRNVALDRKEKGRCLALPDMQAKLER